MSTLYPRKPAVAGIFYPDDPHTLWPMVQQMMPAAESQPVLAVMAPHAGYIYSGGVAGSTLARVDIPETTLILSPKHTRRGKSTALWDQGAWSLPGIKMSINEDLAQHLLQHLSGVSDIAVDTQAHLQEHGIEVLLPFLWTKRPQARFVPIVFDHRSIDECARFGQALAQALQAWPQPVLLLVSSDMNHFEDEEITQHKDQLALEQILCLDPVGLYETCRDHNISMCGVIPMTIAMFALQHIATRQAHLVAHTTSAAVSGNTERVVGYAGVIIS